MHVSELFGFQSLTQVPAFNITLTSHVASLMLLRGAKPKVIPEALGHASVAFTTDVYSHIIEGMQSDAMALLDEVLPVAKNGIPQKINANPECYVE